MGKKGSETRHTAIHISLRTTLEDIKKKFDDRGLGITIKEASILANEKIKRSSKINWEDARDILFNYDYSKRKK